MKLLVTRSYRKATYTIGWLYVDGRRICNTLEDTDRDLAQTMTAAEIRRRKVYGETAIPRGTYNVRMDVVSPKYSAVAWYRSLCGGRMPRLEDVPGYEGILIHPGNSALDTLGCILVGDNTAKGRLTNSRSRFRQIYTMMASAAARGEKITIEIR